MAPGTVDLIEHAVFLLDDAPYIAVQFFAVVIGNDSLPAFGSDDGVVKYLSVAAHKRGKLGTE